MFETGLFASQCLRFREDDRERILRLREGSSTLGSSAEADLRIEAEGVSRRHASLVVRDDRLLVLDLDSKNGTRVNGERVQRAELRAGDRVAFGPVECGVEHLHAEDRRLAIELGDGGELEGALRREDSEASTAAWTAPRTLVESWMELIEGVTSAFGASLTEPLGVVQRRLPASAVAFLEVGRSGPSIRSYVGELDGERVSVASSRTEGWGSCEVNGAPVTWCWRSSDPRLGLVVSGDFEGRPHSEPLLRAILALLERFGRLAPPRATRARGRLRFPENYCVGISEAAVRLHHRVGAVADSGLPVLLRGETGVGKDLLAETLHLSSPRFAGPFVALNCAAIPGDLLEAELFGIGDRVATGVAARKGKFALADGGTLFLDEIAEMAPSLQVKLLRVLQSREVSPIGLAPRKIDVRVVSATNADLDLAMERGEFRRDLYFRLAGSTLAVPTLRERSEDVPVLFEAFLRRFSRESGKLVRGATVRAGHALVSYGWPGNIRELEHVTRWLLSICPQGGVIDFEMLPPEIREECRSRDVDEGSGSRLQASETLELRVLERSAIELAMERTEGNQVRAAKLLGISRDALRRRLKRYGLLP